MASICISLMANNAEHLCVWRFALAQFPEGSLDYDCVLLRLLSWRVLIFLSIGPLSETYCPPSLLLVIVSCTHSLLVSFIFGKVYFTPFVGCFLVIHLGTIFSYPKVFPHTVFL